MHGTSLLNAQDGGIAGVTGSPATAGISNPVSTYKLLNIIKCKCSCQQDPSVDKESTPQIMPYGNFLRMPQKHKRHST